MMNSLIAKTRHNFIINIYTLYTCNVPGYMKKITYDILNFPDSAAHFV